MLINENLHHIIAGNEDRIENLNHIITENADRIVIENLEPRLHYK